MKFVMKHLINYAENPIQLFSIHFNTDDAKLYAVCVLCLEMNFYIDTAIAWNIAVVDALDLHSALTKFLNAFYTMDIE